MDLIDKKLQDEQLSSAIMLCVNLESAFKLYSYRVLDPQTFLANVKTMVEESRPTLYKQLQKVENAEQ